MNKQEVISRLIQRFQVFVPILPSARPIYYIEIKNKLKRVLLIKALPSNIIDLRTTKKEQKYFIQQDYDFVVCYNDSSIYLIPVDDIYDFSTINLQNKDHYLLSIMPVDSSESKQKNIKEYRTQESIENKLSLVESQRRQEQKVRSLLE